MMRRLPPRAAALLGVLSFVATLMICATIAPIVLTWAAP